MRHLKGYLASRRLHGRRDVPPAPDLGLAVVIPCLCEPGILDLLAQLRSCHRPEGGVEVIVVFNHTTDAPESVRAANAAGFETVRRLERVNGDGLRVHALAAFDLPAAEAGVGLARSIGMDEAMFRFAAAGRPDGVIASLDADCRVSSGYLRALERGFAARPNMHAATLAWAHPFESLADPRHRRAVVLYELFLRYIEQGWRHAGLPYAFTAIGSCFAVRAGACARHHGMNRRKAFEDFHFLHKLAREKPLGRIMDARVFPSPRMDGRTPFGTARAVADWYRSGEDEWPVRPPRCFSDLRRMHESLADLYTGSTLRWLGELPPPLASFLAEAGIEPAAAGMRAHAASASAFEKRFYAWFDGLKAWRYVRRPPASMPLPQAAAALLRMDGRQPASGAERLLRQYRRLQDGS